MKTARSRAPLTRNIHLLKWVEKTAELTKPKAVYWVDGSQAEYDKLCQEMVAGGVLTKLNQDLWPGCFLARWLDGTLGPKAALRIQIALWPAL